jgi:hypothetical protein
VCMGYERRSRSTAASGDEQPAFQIDVRVRPGENTMAG